MHKIICGRIHPQFYRIMPLFSKVFESKYHTCSPSSSTLSIPFFCVISEIIKCVKDFILCLKSTLSLQLNGGRSLLAPTLYFPKLQMPWTHTKNSSSRGKYCGVIGALAESRTLSSTKLEIRAK
jgi:hypothetical protein